jgi:hypothetical protein
MATRDSPQENDAARKLRFDFGLAPKAPLGARQISLLGNYETPSFRSLHNEDERQKGEGHPTDEPEQIDECLHLCLTGNLKNYHFYGAW